MNSPPAWCAAVSVRGGGAQNRCGSFIPLDLVAVRARIGACPLGESRRGDGERDHKHDDGGQFREIVSKFFHVRYPSSESLLPTLLSNVCASCRNRIGHAHVGAGMLYRANGLDVWRGDLRGGVASSAKGDASFFGTAAGETRRAALSGNDSFNAMTCDARRLRVSAGSASHARGDAPVLLLLRRVLTGDGEAVVSRSGVRRGAARAAT